VSSVSNGLYFLIVPLVSVTRVVYTSKGMSKKFGVRIIYRKIWYTFLQNITPWQNPCLHYKYRGPYSRDATQT
jgi:hypothetical protein